MNVDRPSALRQITSHDFAVLGLNDVAYITLKRISDREVYAIHTADGNEVAVVENHELALATILQNIAATSAILSISFSVTSSVTMPSSMYMYMLRRAYLALANKADRNGYAKRLKSLAVLLQHPFSVIDEVL